MHPTSSCDSPSVNDLRNAISSAIIKLAFTALLTLIKM